MVKFKLGSASLKSFAQSVPLGTVIIVIVVISKGYSRFYVTGMFEGFFWFAIFDSGIFLGRKIWQVFY